MNNKCHQFTNLFGISCIYVSKTWAPAFFLRRHAEKQTVASCLSAQPPVVGWDWWQFRGLFAGLIQPLVTIIGCERLKRSEMTHDLVIAAKNETSRRSLISEAHVADQRRPPWLISVDNFYLCDQHLGYNRTLQNNGQTDGRGGREIGLNKQCL